ncbi:MAG: phage holin family protein [Bacteroidota bacterium]
MEKISETILKFLRLDSLIQNITGFVETRIELMKIEIREDVAKAVARGLMMGALFLVGFLFLIFFSLGLAILLNSFFEQASAGYWIVTGIYAATFLILLASRKGLQSYFETHMKEMMKRKEK